jgi:hypothetical protein
LVTVTGRYLASGADLIPRLKVERVAAAVEPKYPYEFLSHAAPPRVVGPGD